VQRKLVHLATNARAAHGATFTGEADDTLVLACSADDADDADEAFVDIKANRR
jgi:hypothetical protein